MDEEILKTFKVYKEGDTLIKIDFLTANLKDSKGINRRAELVQGAVNKLLEEDSDVKFHVLVEIIEEENVKLTKEAEEIYAAISNSEQIVNIAVVGDIKTHSRAVDFLLPLTKLYPGKIAWFANKEEALIWLNAHKWDI